jgi:hypothetical protein
LWCGWWWFKSIFLPNNNTMAQKVNSISLRLKKRLNWSTTGSVHNFGDYYNLVYNLSKLTKVNDKIKQKLNINHNIARIEKTSKKYQFFYEIFDQRFFFHFTKLVNSSKRTIQHFYQYKQNNIKTLQLILLNFLINRKQQTHNVTSVQNSKAFKVLNSKKMTSVQVLSPKLITEFIKKQLTEIGYSTLKKGNFGNNLQGNIVNFLHYLLREFKYNLLGIKIICLGRWKKTNTGRKQKIYLKFGQIQSANIANTILYHEINQTTKYGVVSVKVWISHKKNY